MKSRSKVGEKSETFQEMLQRKLGAKRSHSEETNESHFADDNDTQVKTSKKISRLSKEDNSTERVMSAEEDNTGSVTKDMDMLEDNKSDIEEGASPQNIAEQDVQSSAISGTDDLTQEAGNSVSKRLRMYKCERCNSKYMGLAMLRQHCKDVHGDQKYYKCHVCGKLFSHPSSRNIHLRLHSGEKPYKCNTCGKQFRVSSHLKDHVRVHTGERPYICDICHKGFKQSSDLKKHRRTHTLDKPYKCPICPSAFTRSHHCRGHINSVHKFFKCVACSALFTSEEAFERHKELHPSFFPDQSDSQSTSSDSIVPAQSSVPSEISVSEHKERTEEDSEMHEKNLKWDVANQLLELHKISQHITSPRNTHGSSGSETASDSGDEGGMSLKNSSLAPQATPVRSPASSTVIPELVNQGASTHLSSGSHMGQRSNTPPRAFNKENGFHEAQRVQENKVRYPHSPQLSTKGMEYLKVPFQSGYYEREKMSFPSSQENGRGSVSPKRRSPSLGRNLSAQTSEQQKWTTVDQYTSAAYSPVNRVFNQQSHFGAMIDSISQRRKSDFIERSFRGESSQQGDNVVQKPAQSDNNVACHRVSVIQYHSSGQKSAYADVRNQERMINNNETSQEIRFKPKVSPPLDSVSMRLENKPTANQQQNKQLLQNHILPSKDHLAVIPQERIPYVPLNAESSITLQSWNRDDDEQVGKYSWALKEAKKTYEQLKMREQAMQLASNHAMESKQFNIFPQANAQQTAGLFDRSQVRSVDMLKFLAQEQIKQRDTEGDVKSPASAEENSETSDASESGEASNSGQRNNDAGQQSSPPDSLEQRSSPDSSVHHCQVCKKTFSRSSLLKQHSVIHMGNKRFKFRCEVCGKMFRTRSHLRDHTRIHTGERPFKCHICQKAFKQSSDLKKHINLHTGANQFKCEECNMEFRRADALRKHKLGHKMGNMPCGHCGKNFLHISALRQHRAMHNVQPVKTNRAFHRCNYCFKTFTKAESYRIHIEEHNREQSGAVFDCKICSMKFFSEAEFTDHMNIHDGKRPYKCFVCEKEFCIAEHLQDHVRLHSDVTSRLKCEEGDSRFQGPDNLIRHSAIHA